MIKKLLPFSNGFLLALCIVLTIIVWKSYPFGEVYVSDMDNWEIVSWNWAQPQRNATINGQSLVINEVVYPKGIGTHAPNSIKIPVPAGYTHFVADVGVSDEVANDAPSSVAFRVLGDGVVLCETPVIRANSPAWRIDVNVQWMGELLLEITDGGDGANSDHALWGAARFVRR